MQKIIAQSIEESILIKEKILNDSNLQLKIATVVDKCISALNSGNKILLCGNGGSASDAQHIAAELSGRFYFDRPPLNAEALHVNSSYLTAVANDYGYEKTYSRMVEAKGKKGDILLAFSTSGKSKNILNAISIAKKIGIYTVGFTGSEAALMHDCSVNIEAPSSNTPRIQEAHILIGHIICQIIEHKMFQKQ